MFGRKSGFSGKRVPEWRTEARKIETIKRSIAAAVHAMKAHAYAPRPDLCEEAARQVAELLKTPKAPQDFVQQMRAKSDDLLKSCFMKAASAASAHALAAARAGDEDLRSRKIGEARTHLARALQMKAPPEFKLACDRAIEAATLAGVDPGPTRPRFSRLVPTALVRSRASAASTRSVLDHWPAPGEFVYLH